MSNPHTEAPGATPAAPGTDEFLTALEEAYQQVKQVRRSIRPADRLGNGLGLDSLDAMELLLALEQRYGVTLIGTVEITRVDTVAELHELVRGLVTARTA